MTTTYDEIVERILAGGQASTDDVLTVLRTPDEEVMDLVAAVSRLRRAHFGMTVKVNYLVNLKSGLCPEDCGYCSQALGSTSEILRYTWLGKDEALAQAEAGLRGGATRVCMVASGRGPTDRDIDRVADMVGAIKDENPDVEVCACLGLLKDGQAERLRAAGVDAYNHNINTAESHHDTIVSTHTYEDRVRTVAKAQGAGLSACSGLIAGLGESDEQLVEALTALRDMGSDSIPVNFLMPFDGTPKQQTWELTPLRCLKILAAARVVAPATEVRIAAGREMHLRSLQAVALHLASSIFLGDYLTSEGQSAQDDLDLLADSGFTILGADELPAGERTGDPVIRRRGAGTAEPANA